MLTNFDDNADAEGKELCLEFRNNQSLVKVSYYLLDEQNNNALLRVELFSAETFRSHLKADLYSVHMIKIEKLG